MTSSLPSSVTILDLPVATLPPTGSESFEVVQGSTSARVTLAQMMQTTVGALPTGGASGMFLGKNSSTDYDSTWRVVNLGNGTSSFTGSLTVPFGGTGTSTLTAHGVMLGNGSSTVSIAAAMSSGQLLIGQTVTTDPVPRTVVGDFSISPAGTSVVTNVNGVAFPASPATLTVPFVTASNTVNYTTVTSLIATYLGTGRTASGTFTVSALDTLIYVTGNTPSIFLPAGTTKIGPVKIVGASSGIFATSSSILRATAAGDTISGLATTGLTVNFQVATLTPLPAGGYVIS